MQMRYVFIGPLVIAVSALLLVTGCSNPDSGQARQARPTPRVGVVTVQPQAVQLHETLPGRTVPYRVAQIRPQVNGIVQQRAFEEGSEVAAGQLLYQIDPRLYQAQYNSAKANLAKARAAVSSITQKAARYKDLLADHAVSAQAYADIKADLQQRLAQVQVAEAGVQKARINLHYTKINAPIAGQIGRSFVTEGALVTANQQQKLAQVTQLDPIYVDIQRSAKEVLRLKRELKQGKLAMAGANAASVTLYFADGRKYKHAGKLQFSGVTVDADTGSVTIRAVIPNPDHVLLPGMFVRARLSEGVQKNALLVPQQGVNHDRKGQAFALVVDKDNMLQRRMLQTDRAIGSYWLVTDGLSAGDRVVVSGSKGARAGSKVKPVPAEIPNELSTGTDKAGPGDNKSQRQEQQTGSTAQQKDASDRG